MRSSSDGNADTAKRRLDNCAQSSRQQARIEALLDSPVTRGRASQSYVPHDKSYRGLIHMSRASQNLRHRGRALRRRGGEGRQRDEYATGYDLSHRGAIAPGVRRAGGRRRTTRRLPRKRATAKRKAMLSKQQQGLRRALSHARLRETETRQMARPAPDPSSLARARAEGASSNRGVVRASAISIRGSGS